MVYNTDGGGFAFKCSDCKLMVGASTWATRIVRQIIRGNPIRIVTYSLPNVAYINDMFSRHGRSDEVYIIAHAKFLAQAERIKSAFPGFCLSLLPDLHAKVVLVEPNTVIVGSANFGSSGWTEASIGIRSREAHDWYLAHEWYPLWERAVKVSQP